eukprot:9500940-Pyramimonas_sp.AAC.2
MPSLLAHMVGGGSGYAVRRIVHLLQVLLRAIDGTGDTQCDSPLLGVFCATTRAPIRKSGVWGGLLTNLHFILREDLYMHTSQGSPTGGTNNYPPWQLPVFSQLGQTALTTR